MGADTVTTHPLDFWLEYGSPYTYLTVARIEDLARVSGVTVTWKPFLLYPILMDMGWKQEPFIQFPVKGRYMWRDLERRAKRHGLPYNRPSVFPPDPLLTARIGCLAAQEGWCPAFTRATFSAHWVDGRIIGTPENLDAVLAGLGKDPEQIKARAQTDENKLRLRQQTSEAADLGIFGSPSFVVNGELFWGDDRLEDALDCAREG